MHQPFDRLGFDRRMTRDEINSLPIRHYHGKINVVTTQAALDRAVKELTKEKVLGFDTETKPNYKKGQENLPALIQLAGERSIYLFQLQPLDLPAKLRNLLENERILKMRGSCGSGCYSTPEARSVHRWWICRAC